MIKRLKCRMALYSNQIEQGFFRRKLPIWPLCSRQSIYISVRTITFEQVERFRGVGVVMVVFGWIWCDMKQFSWIGNANSMQTQLPYEALVDISTWWILVSFITNVTWALSFQIIIGHINGIHLNVNEYYFVVIHLLFHCFIYLNVFLSYNLPPYYGFGIKISKIDSTIFASF